MSLATGTRLGPYEILGVIGAGGMGEVYRARDTRLDRTVAIKVLPANLLSEPEAKQRFEREARAVSSLNHPHICVLYDVGTDFFVMEYLEGESLAARLEKGPLAPAEVLRIGIEVADALSAAHRADLIHRDLKPGNIMLTKSGAKLLDFGLARSAGLEAPTDATKSPTLSRPLTKAGTIVGTFQYMAPEQLEGRDTDARTDIFALGSVLYEMATGKRAFAGSSQASLIASILKEEPRAMSELVPMTPPALEHVVKRCLAKEPENRWQNVRDVMLELQWIRDAGSSAGLPAPVVTHRRKTTRAAWIAAAIAGAAAIGFGSLVLTRRPATPALVRFAVTPPPNHSLVVGPHVAISPDGSQLAFCATDTLGVDYLWLRRLDTMNATRLVGTRGVTLPFWSPDGRHLGFFSEGKLRRVAIADGMVQDIADAPDARGGTWSANDDIVYQPAASGPLYHVSARGGHARAVTVVDTTNGDDAHRFPSFLPDGNHFLFVVLPARETFAIRVGSLDGKTNTEVARGNGAAVYSRSGHLLYNRQQHLVAQPFDARSLKTTGDAVTIGELAGANGGFSAAPGLSVSNNDVIARGIGDIPNTTVSWSNRKGQITGRLALPDGIFAEPRISPDGRRAVLSELRLEGGGTLWMVDLERDVATRFTSHISDNGDAIWSPDGKSIVFTSGREGRENLYIKPSDASREEERLFDSGALFTKTEDWAPDGSGIVYSVLTEKTNSDLWFYPVVGERTPRVLLRTRFNEMDAVISPDGRWIAYRSDDSGRPEVYAQSFPDMGPRFRVTTESRGVYRSINALWTVEWVGHEICYVAADGVSLIAAPAASAGASLDLGTPVVQGRLPMSTYSYGLDPRGGRMLVCGPDLGGVPLSITVVMNWPSLLVRK